MSQREEGPIRKADDIGKGESGEGFWTPRRIVAAVVVVLLLTFAILNREDAEVDFGPVQATLPLFVVIALCGLVGFAAGYFIRGRHEKHD
jgi:uncharacterized integral membrane protein